MTADKERNIAHARTAIQDAAEKGAKLVVLPVSFFFFFKFIYDMRLFIG